MAETSYTAEQLRDMIAKLEATLARGVLKTSINGESVEFGNAGELRDRIAYFRAELTRLTSGTSRGGLSVSYPTTSRGL